MDSLTECIADFVVGLDMEHIDGEVASCARGRILDAFSTAVGSRIMEAARLAVEYDSSAGSTGVCTVLSTGTRTTPGGAAFVNGVAVHAILFEDVDLGTASHPGAVIVPAALAAAEAVAASRSTAAGPVTLEDLLRGVLAGYEVHLRLGELAADGIYKRGARTTSYLGTVGAAAAACAVGRFPQPMVATALALAANFSFGFLEGFASGTMEPYLQAGMAAQQGLIAAKLATLGATASRITFEGPAGYLRVAADIFDTSDLAFPDRWAIRGVSSKPYPIAGGRIGPVDSALSLVEAGLDHRDIEMVEVRMPPGLKEFPGSDKLGPFSTIYEAQESTQFCIASALLGRPMGKFDTILNHLADEQVTALSSKIRLVSEPGRRLSRVEVLLKSGEVRVGEFDGRERQVPNSESMRRKFEDLAQEHLGVDRCKAVADLVLVGERPPVSAIMSHFREAGRSRFTNETNA